VGRCSAGEDAVRLAGANGLGDGVLETSAGLDVGRIPEQAFFRAGLRLPCLADPAVHVRLDQIHQRV